MKKRYALCLITCIVMTLCLFGIHNLTKTEEKHIKVGFIFVGDEITPYTNNFIKARNHIKEVYGDRIECVTTYNVTEGQIEKPLQELIDGGCDYIIAASYGYGPDVKAVTTPLASTVAFVSSEVVHVTSLSVTFSGVNTGVSCNVFPI